MTRPETVAITNPDPNAERVAALRSLFPEALTESGLIDPDKLRAVLDQAVDTRLERYTLTWVGKRDALTAIQQPTTATLVPVPEESINWDTTRHLFIEGENLEVLKLLFAPYHGRVKMIYIDPPYNTGKDFIYRDDFSIPISSHLDVTGQCDSDGNLLTSNPETDGRYHSAWLSMMYPRLFLARQLLRDDGVIFVSIDDNEVHNLRLLMNEIFGEKCFKNCIIFRRGIKNVQAQFDTIDSLTVGHEYILVYARNLETRFQHLRLSLDEPKQGSWNNHWRGTDRPTMRYPLFGIVPEQGQWRWSEKRSHDAINNFQRMLRELGLPEDKLTQAQIDAWYQQTCEHDNEDIDLLRLSATGNPEHYVPPTDSKLGSDLWTDLSPRGSAELAKLMQGKVFDNPKPSLLIRRMLEWITMTDQNDIVLDFFAGSCTTAQAVLELNHEDGGNRQFIMIQVPEPTGRKDFPSIADIGKERIRRVIACIQTESTDRPAPHLHEDLGFRVFKRAPSAVATWQPSVEATPAAYTARMAFALDPLDSTADVTAIIAEVALKTVGFPLTYMISTLSTSTTSDKRPETNFYRVTDSDTGQFFLLSLASHLTLELLEPLNLSRDDTFICRAAALDDDCAANLALQCKLMTI